MDKVKYEYAVKHPQYGEAKVTAEDRLHAVVEAAHSWGIMKWTGIARDCEIIRLGPAPEEPKKRGTKKTAKRGSDNGD